MTTTARRKKPATAASRRSLKSMRCAASSVFAPGGSVPAASASPIMRACDRKPIFGFDDQILSAPALIVTDTSHASGSSVTNA